MSISDKSVAITGAGCGVGRASALFLASDEAESITGVLLPIDGGYVAA